MAFQFKIQIKGIQKPPVWRRLIVPETFTFEQFHALIQAAFGWDDYHLYQFSPQGYGSYPLIGLIEDGDFDGPDTDACKTKLKKIFTAEKQKFTYIYDFGDDWIHSIVLEKILAEKVKMASCIGGKGCCPPEDCGGVWGYADLLEVLSNPQHEEYAGMREWLGLDEGEQWDVNEFDLELTNAYVNSVN